MNLTQKKPGLIRESSKTSLFIGLGVASKMAVDLVVAASFGLGAHTDSFFVAYTLPLIIEALIYPACQSGLVPVFIRQMRPEQGDEKWLLFSTLFNIGLLTSGILFVLGVVGAPWIVSMVAPGIDRATYELAVRLTRILFLGTLFVGPVGVMRAFLNSHNLFTAPAMLELIRGVAVLAIIILAYRNYGIEALAVGFMLGGSLQFAILAGVIVRKLGFGYRLTIKLRSLRSSQTGRLFMVPFADYLLAQTILITQRVIGSFLPPGSISAISYGFRLASVIGVMLFSGVEVVSLSALAADFAGGTAVHLHRARETFIKGLRLVFVLGIPIAVGIWILSFPLTQLLLQRGAFDQQDTRLAAPVVGLYALSIPFFGHWLLLKNYLFASIQPRKILFLSSVVASVNIALALLLWRYLGARSVALAYVGGLGSVYGFAFLVLDKKLMPFQKTMIRLALRVVAASIVMGFVLYSISDQAAKLLSKVTNLPEFVVLVTSLALAGILGAILLLGALMTLRVEEATAFLKYLKRLRTPTLDYQAD